MSLNMDRQGHYGEQALHAKYAVHRHGRKRPSTEMALREKGDDYPTPCPYITCTATIPHTEQYLYLRAYKYFQEQIYLRSEC